MAVKADDIQIAKRNWERYQHAKKVGHDRFVELARRNEDYYLGGGLQWSEGDRAAMDAAHRPMIELNHILPAVQTALGLQLQSRVDIDFQPRGEGADDLTASVLSKVIRCVSDQLEYHWKESLQYEDGLIQQRGFLDFRVEFGEHFMGDITCEVLDPLDVMPDPDAQGYEPEKWADVTVVRWMTFDDLSDKYGEKKAKELSHEADEYFEDDYSDRAHFGDDADGKGGYDGWVEEDDKLKLRRYMVIDRQFWRTVRENAVVFHTGEIRATSTMTPEQIAHALTAGHQTKTNVRKVRWTVTCGRVVLHDDWSPYRTFTVVPYFPIFRRGRTRGMVDNLRSPQELENKALTNYLEILNTTANSGWDIEENSLANMEPEDLAKYGSKNGLVLVYRKGATPPARRQPNQPPTGTEHLVDRANWSIKEISGMSDSLQGQKGPEVSGVAIQSKQYQGQMQMGRPLDNLALTRRIAARKMLELVQQFYTEERVFRIVDDTTDKVVEELAINRTLPDGSILNDVTIGRYDVVVTDTPTHATFQQNQFDQMVALLDKGVPIPTKFVLEASSVVKKHEIAEAIDAQQEQSDPEVESKVALNMAGAKLREAQALKTEADMVNTGIDAQYSAVQTAGMIAQTPATASLADQLLLSAGYIDKDAPPIVPQVQGGQQLMAPDQMQLPPNTNPIAPVPPPQPGSPAVGANAGIETQRFEGAG